MKLIRNLVIVMLVLAAALILGKDAIARAALIRGVKAMTGLSTRVDRLRMGLVNTDLGITGLRVFNPRGFPDEVLLDVPELYVNYDLASFLGGKAHLETIRLTLSELNVIRSAEGQLNLHGVKALEPGTATQEVKQQPPGRPPEFHIDLLDLRVDTVVYKDYTVSPPLVKEFAVNLHERYEHITNPSAFAGLVVSRALMKTTIAQLAHFDLNALQADVTNALRLSADRLSSGVLGTAQQLGTDPVGTAQDAAKKAADRIQQLLGN